MENISKRCWIDVETSGLSPRANCILTMGILIDIGGQVVEELSIKMRPSPGAEISPEALKVNGLTKEEIIGWPSQKDGYDTFRGAIDAHVDKYKRSDKLVFCAYNANFDDGFCRSLFKRNNDKYYGSYFHWPKIDVQTLLAIAISNGLSLPKYNLVTVCEHFDIKLDAHEAMSDIKATRELYYKLRSDICL